MTPHAQPLATARRRPAPPPARSFALAKRARAWGRSTGRRQRHPVHSARIASAAEDRRAGAAPYSENPDGSNSVLGHYEYDLNGNRTKIATGAATATYDGHDRLTSNATAAFTYNDQGALATRTPSGGSATSYVYDTAGNLRKCTPPAGSAITYLVDGLQRRVGTKSGSSFAGGLLYGAGAHPVASVTSTGTLSAVFGYVTRSHVPDWMKTPSDGKTYRILTDHLGSVRLVVNTSDGTIAQRMDYDAWGNVTYETGAAFQPFGFAGGIYDRTSGFTRFGARDYDPTIGRWVSKDESRFAGGLNFYVYANNDPVNLIDPNGRWPMDSRRADKWGQYVAQNPSEAAPTALVALAAIPVVDEAAAALVLAGIGDVGAGAVVTAGGVGGGVLVEAEEDAPQMCTVSRWGRAGLEPGDWVMNGPANRTNYVLSGKWQPGIGNDYAPFSSGQQYEVPKDAVQWPSGWGLDGWIKGLFGQRRYFP